MTLPRYAYLGPSGTFTEAALLAMVDPSEVEAVPAIDVLTALAAVRDGDVDYAVVAIENTVEGGVTATLDTLAAGAPLVILGEVVLPVSFELVARPGTAIEDVTAVAAHSHGLAQCRRWLADRLPGAVHVSATSNAAAAGELAQGATGFEAALAPPGLGARLGLEVLAAGVADNAHAATRFVKVGRPTAVPAPTGADKTTLVVHLPDDRAGALLEMLEQFAARGVNLSRIESRPRSDRPGEYSFSIDALGHIDEPRMAEALMGLRRTNPVVTFLGSYPAATGYPTPITPGTSAEDFSEARAWVQGLRSGRH
ncbi:prephenate dehydratase [Demequina sediminis]|uniref:Prephenate dehydratase n=1 Tax=Demequina sediminis TaxID=1930058 RepID=A0ABP9WHQ5_9MICO|nr:prephenate dehydratase [Demequina sediminis]BDZ62262.1 prephenate dehydratase [Demequina sediminis]